MKTRIELLLAAALLFLGVVGVLNLAEKIDAKRNSATVRAAEITAEALKESARIMATGLEAHK